MRERARMRCFSLILAVVLVAGTIPSGLAAQDRASRGALSASVDPRLEITIPGRLLADQSAWPATPQGALAGALENRRPLFSGRGAAYGAAIGCAVGAVWFYAPDMPNLSQSLAWSGAGCVLLVLPGAYFGALFIR